MKKIMCISLALCLLLAGACSVFEESKSDDDNTFLLLALASSPVSKTSVLNNYADMAYYNYNDALVAAKSLQTEVNTFTASAGTDAGLTSLQTTYRDARRIYLQTEAFRFSDGPIDNTTVFSIEGEEVEGLLNAWPLDESHITGTFTTTATLPITEANLMGQNGNGGEDKISVGWHVIEFMLWGSEVEGAGSNSYNQTAGTRDGSSDFDTADTGTENARNSLFLKTATDLLVSHLELLTAQWDPSVSGNYRATFLTAGTEDTYLKAILTGLATLSQGEWGGERLKGLTSFQQNEDEHSCFSDLTKEDFYYDAQGVLNVYTGVYNGTTGSTNGPGLIVYAGSDATTIQASITASRDIFSNDTSWRYDAVIHSSASAAELLVRSSLSDMRTTIVGLSESFESIGKNLGYTITPTP